MKPSTTPAPSAAHDFDFLVGSWTTRQRRLTKRLQGSDDWESFEATSTMQRLPGGIANFDTLVAEAWRPGWVGMSFRVFNPNTQLWSIYWVSNDGGGIDARSGRLEPPVVGRFEGEHGLFEGEDCLEGRPIRVRYLWTRLGPDAARWQQLFSADAGQSWELNWVMDFQRTKPADPAAMDAAPAIDFDSELVELRQYTSHDGQRDVLIDLFEREFIETQEAAGMAVLGQFRDLDAGRRFVWLRGFADLHSRAQALAAFYDGPVWRQHRDAARATMVDSDDVLLLQPAWPGGGLRRSERQRAKGAVRMSAPGLLDTRLCRLREAASPELLRHCREVVTPALTEGGAEVLGWYVTAEVPNNFPRLPVRHGEHMLVVLLMFPTFAAAEACEGSGLWAGGVQPGLEPWLAGAPQRLRLVATARSALHG